MEPLFFVLLFLITWSDFLGLQIKVHCTDRSFAYQNLEELHHPWVKKLFLGFARTSEFNGPRMPTSSHYLIQEVNSESSSVKPMLQLTYRIFGSSPPIRSFDPAKMLTVSSYLLILFPNYFYKERSNAFNYWTHSHDNIHCLLEALQLSERCIRHINVINVFNLIVNSNCFFLKINVLFFYSGFGETSNIRHTIETSSG